MHSLFVTCHVLLLATTAPHGACGADGQGQQQSLKDAGAPSPLRSTGPPRFQNYHDGVWAAPHVPAWRVGQARVFEPSAGHRVAVMPLPNQRHFHALRQIASDCDAGWEPLLSYNDEDIPTFACKPTPSRAEADRRDFYTDNTTRQLLRRLQRDRGAGAGDLRGSSRSHKLVGNVDWEELRAPVDHRPE